MKLLPRSLRPGTFRTLGMLAAAIWLVAAGPPPRQPSVLVQLQSMHKGSLPRIVAAYGTVQPSAAAQHTVMAALSATVADLYVRPGQQVAKDAPLLRLSPSPTTTAAYTRAETAQSVADELVARTRGMVAQHLATQQQLAQAEQAQANARATLTALQAQGANGPSVLHAPFAAIVTMVSITPGTIVTEGSALLTLARPEGLVLKVGVVPAEAATIATGDPAALHPIGSDQTIRGKVSLRGAVVDAADGLVPVTISLPPGSLLPNQLARANITTGQVTGYLVPHAAILVNHQGAPYVVQAVNLVAHEVAVDILAGHGSQMLSAARSTPPRRWSWPAPISFATA